MRIEDQVVSLELAKKLKALGVMQESVFWYLKGNENYIEYTPSPTQTYVDKVTEASAFTVAELGELLPNEIADTELFTPMIQKRMKHHKNRWSWHLNYYGGVEKTFLFDEFVIDDTEANARAKVLIHLIESGIIDPKDGKGEGG